MVYEDLEFHGTVPVDSGYWNYLWISGGVYAMGVERWHMIFTVMVSAH